MNAPLLRGSIAATALGASLILTGCTNDMSGMPMGGRSTMPSTMTTPTTSASTAASFNDADVRFAQMMVPHHTQAVAMSDTVLAKAGLDPDIETLATGIQNAQQPEIDTMNGWLAAWGQPAGGGMTDMNHGGNDGMATDAELKDLADGDTPIAQKLYLELMIKHHQGAIGMAKSEITGGKDTGAVALARSIDTTQRAEITEMNAILGRL